jgi:7-cyano-7-deazaguanine synthase
VSGARAIVLLSGGLDSAVCLWWARAEGYDVHALTFDFPGRPPRELAAARLLAAAAHATLEVVSLPFLREMPCAPPGYLPGRNLVYYAIAASRAEALGASAIVGGHIATDPDGFPDASPAFFDALGRTLQAGASPARILRPLAGLSKVEAIRRAIALGVPLDLTVSCYASDDRPCGRCVSCDERATAFAAVGVADPALI